MSLDDPTDAIQSAKSLARTLYRQCKNAGGDYVSLSHEVRDLRTVLKHLEFEVQDEDSILNNREGKNYAKELGGMVHGCEDTLRKLEALLDRLEKRRNSGATSGAARRPSEEMDELGEVRMQLISHKTNVTTFLDAIQLQPKAGSGNRMSSLSVAATLDTHSEQLDMILDKVDNIAARMGQRASSTMTSYGDDDPEVWKQFRRELIQEGFSSDVLAANKDVLRAYIRQIEQDGLLDEAAPITPLPSSPASAHTERWLDTVAAPPPAIASTATLQAGESESIPPAFESLHIHEEDLSAKQMAVHEEGMKFPQSMKREMKGLAEGESSGGKDIVPQRDKIPDAKENTTRGLGLALAPIITAPAPEPLDATTGALVITTRELVRYNAESNTRHDVSMRNSYSASPSTSPIDPRGMQIPTPRAQSHSQASGSGSRLAPDAHHQGHHYGTSPSHSPSHSRQGSYSSAYGTSPSNAHTPRGPSLKTGLGLAPDSQGREIPPEATWTRIRRSLVSTEVLEQDKRRYEATPEFVAVLGVLEKREIEELVRRSWEMRQGRRRGGGGGGTGGDRERQQQQQQARPKSRDTPRDRDRRVKFTGSGSSSRDVSPGSDSSSSSDLDRDRRRRRERKRDRERERERERAARLRDPQVVAANTAKNAQPNPHGFVASPPPMMAKNPYVPFSGSGGGPPGGGGGPPYLQPVNAPRYPGPPFHSPGGGQPSYPPLASAAGAQYPQPLPQPWLSPQPGYASPQPLYSPLWAPQPGHPLGLSPNHSPRGSADSGRGVAAAGGNRDGKEVDKVERKRRRFRDLTAAGIGGAAVSLLSVLSEAAEGL